MMRVNVDDLCQNALFSLIIDDAIKQYVKMKEAG